MVPRSISHYHHLPLLSVDYTVNFVVEEPTDHEWTNVFPQLINNIELIIDLHPIYEPTKIQKIDFKIKKKN